MKVKDVIRLLQQYDPELPAMRSTSKDFWLLNLIVSFIDSLGR